MGREAGAAESRANHETVLSALLMLARVRNAMRYAVNQLLGIGILVEILRRLGFAFVTVRARAMVRFEYFTRWGQALEAAGLRPPRSR